jgi:hypothetical protein
LVIISNTTGLSFALERIRPLATIIIIVFYLLVLYLLALSNTPENLFANIYSESLIKTACQHLLLLVGFDTLIYRKYYDTPPILMGHHRAGRYWLRQRGTCANPWPRSSARAVRLQDNNRLSAPGAPSAAPARPLFPIRAKGRSFPSRPCWRGPGRR